MRAVATNTSIRSAGFWTDLRPAEHIVQCWTHEETLLDALEGFVAAGLRAGEGVAVICTAPHLHALEKRLRAHWLDIDRARWERRYFPLLAQEIIAKVLGEDGFPDDDRFRAALVPVLRLARGEGRKARFFGEAVNLLVAQGKTPAAIRLESLWSAFIAEHQVPLFCAYDRLLFMDDAEAMKRVCGAHTMRLPG
jgi:hypothetical protein